MDRAEAADRGRREFLELGGGAALLGLLVAAGILRPSEARAAGLNRAAFGASSMKDALEALGAGTPAEGKEIVLTAPDVAEDGAVVPIAVVSYMPRTESIAILVEENPGVLAASFLLSAAAVPEVSTRVKMAKTSHVSALVKADGKFYVARRGVRVTVGGCGG